jgi:WD40 repeat protein
VLNTGGHLAKVEALAFTPDGKKLVSASADKTVRIWDMETGKAVRVIRGQAGAGEDGRIFAIALSPDGRSLAVGGRFPGGGEDSGAIRLYDFASGALVSLLKGHRGPVYALAYSPDGSQLISGSQTRRPSSGTWRRDRRFSASPRSRATKFTPWVSARTARASSLAARKRR